jgi:hypothetical protein
MFRMLRRTVQIGACAAVLAAWLPPAQGAPAACVVAWRNADKLAKVGQLRSAKTSMLKCAHHTCGTVLHKECSRRVAELENDTPTIVPVVKDEDGNAVSDVDVVMDGEVVASGIDGRAVMVDPGTHEFTFQRGNRVLASYRTTILQGQRNRTVEVSLRDEDRPVVRSRLPPGAVVAGAAGRSGAPVTMVPEQEIDVDTGGRRLTPGSVTLGVVGALGLAGYGGALYQGNKENADLDLCLPAGNCRPEAVNRVRNFYQAARISLGIGLVALAGAAYLYFTSDSDDDAELALTRPKYRFDVQAAQSGGLAGFSGSF